MQAEHHAYKQGITCAVRDPRAGRGPTNMLACFPRRVSGAVCAVLAKPSILALAETLLALSMPCLAATSNNMQWAIECSPTCIKTANVQHGQPPQPCQGAATWHPLPASLPLHAASQAGSTDRAPVQIAGSTREPSGMRATREKRKMAASKDLRAGGRAGRQAEPLAQGWFTGKVH